MQWRREIEVVRGTNQDNVKAGHVRKEIDWYAYVASVLSWALL